MLNFPKTTEFGRRIPKQKFYEHLDVTPELRRMFVDQVKLITWQNKLSAQTMNLAPGQIVTEIEVFRLRLQGQEIDPSVLRLMDKQIPYHILDFFSGSATTAHAVMQLNAEDSGHRKSIMVQLPEPCDEKSEAYHL